MGYSVGPAQVAARRGYARKTRAGCGKQGCVLIDAPYLLPTVTLTFRRSEDAPYVRGSAKARAVTLCALRYNHTDTTTTVVHR